MKADAQPNGAILEKADSDALSASRSNPQIGLAGRFDQVPVVVYADRFWDILEVVGFRIPIGEQVGHDEIRVTPASRQPLAVADSIVVAFGRGRRRIEHDEVRSAPVGDLERDPRAVEPVTVRVLVVRRPDRLRVVLR